MKVYHVVIALTVLTLLLPKLGWTIVAGLFFLAAFLWLLAFLMGFPGWRSNKPHR
ncbi:hypothetical protein D9M68_790230 [compost metagenome]